MVTLAYSGTAPSDQYTKVGSIFIAAGQSSATASISVTAGTGGGVGTVTASIDGFAGGALGRFQKGNPSSVTFNIVWDNEPENLGVTPGNTDLVVSWTAPANPMGGDSTGNVIGYDVHYTSAARGTVADDAAASGNDASVAWVDAGHTGTTASLRISGLTNDTPYRVRVRTVNRVVNNSMIYREERSDWVHGSGTPAQQTQTPQTQTPPGDALWSATLTADKEIDFYGCDNFDTGQDDCSDPAVLTDDNFTYKGTSYTIAQLYWNSGTKRLVFRVAGSSRAEVEAALGSLKLIVDGTPFAISDTMRSRQNELLWSYEPAIAWTDGQQVQLSLREALPPTAVEVTASGPLREGGSVDLTFTLDQPAPAGMRTSLMHDHHPQWFQTRGPVFAEGATTAVMRITVPQDAIDNNCRTLNTRVRFGWGGTGYANVLDTEVSLSVVDDDGTPDTCSGLLGSPQPTALTFIPDPRGDRDFITVVCPAHAEQAGGARYVCDHRPRIRNQQLQRRPEPLQRQREEAAYPRRAHNLQVPGRTGELARLSGDGLHQGRRRRQRHHRAHCNDRLGGRPDRDGVVECRGHAAVGRPAAGQWRRSERQ